MVMVPIRTVTVRGAMAETVMCMAAAKDCGVRGGGAASAR